MVMNTITQIENQYQQIQQAVERAKSIDWDNIRFDGDFDIRNDIKDANKRVNKLLNQTRQIKNTLPVRTLTVETAATLLQTSAEWEVRTTTSSVPVRMLKHT